ncbi:hypothetical protein V6N13_069374 [Hibiscus sabdariffa]|uniref:Uncharacterized protein n=1 Tax=Hibiscus sabdariffa TaxID=183260 RepID=A0ABR2PG37_9ROSI
MFQQTRDPKFSEFGLLNPENNSPACDKQCSVGAKKTPLRDLQNQNRIVPNSTGSSPFSKDREPCVDPIKVSGTKRASPECALSPSQCQSPSNTAANRHLVYVRRKCEAELGKSSAFDCIGTSNCQQLRQSATKLTPLESNQHPVAAASPLFSSPKGIRNLHWKEQYYQLQMLLKKLDQSDQEDYTQMLRCSSAVGLSRHAVELEKRSIQLSLKEAKELQRVVTLNILGKTLKMVTAPFTQTDQSCK